ncbi:hypothetical protein C8N46_11299 [Kordia periserrulae]|uniref:Lipoprotein n=1 Tax=Kordia periserrulae TaxID=701523 RepID=A0A2T6BRT6_9FLAO|nr:hypothetical protein [Kordia periserrulae]PTX58791.1 hypothetical protein C8N46_11299 [Kordia periserrulae]
MKKLGIILFIAAFVTSCTNFGEKKVFDGTEIYYKDGITEAEVDKLGESLVTSGFTNGELKSVQFVKEGDSYLFKMVINQENLNNESLENVFTYFPKELSQYMNLPVDLYLCDNYFNTLRVYKLKDAPKLIMANATEIRYTNKVMPDDAEKLKEFLIDYGFATHDVRKTVVLDRESMTYIFKMVINKYRINDDATIGMVTLFKSELSKKVFSNLPVKVHLCDDLMNTLKVI